MKVFFYTSLALVAFAFNSILCRLALRGEEADAAGFTGVRLASGAVALVVIGYLVSTGYNSATTFDKFQTYPGAGASDYFGFGASSRALPSAIPANQRLIQGQFTQQQLQGFGQSFSPNWGGQHRTLRRGRLSIGQR